MNNANPVLDERVERIERDLAATRNQLFAAESLIQRHAKILQILARRAQGLTAGEKEEIVRVIGIFDY
jgi:hypothetical protein